MAWVQAKEDRTHISCNVWSWDWTTQNPDRITETVLKKTLSYTGAGSIIVLHDGKAGNARADRSGTVEATDRIITALKQDGYEFVRLSDVGSNGNQQSVIGCQQEGLDYKKPRFMSKVSTDSTEL